MAMLNYQRVYLKWSWNMVGIDFDQPQQDAEEIRRVKSYQNGETWPCHMFFFGIRFLYKLFYRFQKDISSRIEGSQEKRLVLLGEATQMGGVHSHGDPQNGWFISWIILWTNGWFRGTPISGNLRMNNIGYIGWWFQRLFWNFLKQLEKHHDQTSAKLLCGDFFFGKHWDITKKFEVVQIRSFGPSAFARNINHWVPILEL